MGWRGGRGGRGGGRGHGPGGRGFGAAAAAGQGGPVAAPVITWYCERCGDERHDSQARHLAMHAALDRKEREQQLRKQQARDAYKRAHGSKKKWGRRQGH